MHTQVWGKSAHGDMTLAGIWELPCHSKSRSCLRQWQKELPQHQSCLPHLKMHCAVNLIFDQLRTMFTSMKTTATVPVALKKMRPTVSSYQVRIMLTSMKTTATLLVALKKTGPKRWGPQSAHIRPALPTCQL